MPRTRPSPTKSGGARGADAGEEPAESLAREALERARYKRTLGDRFRTFAGVAGNALGSPWAFFSAFAFVIVWATCGPYFGYSNGWQLVINTSTTIATFLMVFLLQSTQNRDTKAINVKLDELLRAIRGARTGLADLGDLTDAELDRIEHDLVDAARKAGVNTLPLTRGMRARADRARRRKKV